MKHVISPGNKLHQYVVMPLTIGAICSFINLFNLQCLYAQDARTTSSMQGKLKSFEGFYQFQDNKDAFLQVKAKGDSLILKQLWDGKEFAFEQTSPLEFYCKAQSFPLKFKDSAGSIIQVLAFNRDVWNKVKNYQPAVVKEIRLAPTQLKTLEGKYKIKGGDEDDVLQITSSGNNLILKQLWDGQEITFVPQSPLDFYCKEKLFPLKFSKDKNGIVTQVLAFNRDVWIKEKE
jgi:hypothetical protein